MKKVILLFVSLFVFLSSFAQRVRVGIDINEDIPPTPEPSFWGLVGLLVFSSIVYLVYWLIKKYDFHLSDHLDFLNRFQFIIMVKRVYETIVVAGNTIEDLLTGIKVQEEEIKRDGFYFDYSGGEGYYMDLNGYFVVKKQVGKYLLMEGDTELFGWIEVYARKSDLRKSSVKKYVLNANELRDSFRHS